MFIYTEGDIFVFFYTFTETAKTSPPLSAVTLLAYFVFEYRAKFSLGLLW